MLQLGSRQARCAIANMRKVDILLSSQRKPVADAPKMAGGQFTLPQELEDHVTRRFSNTQLDLKAADGLFEWPSFTPCGSGAT